MQTNTQYYYLFVLPCSINSLYFNLHLHSLIIFYYITFQAKNQVKSSYTPCELKGHEVSSIVSRCARGAICARSLECEHSDLTSLDYVASGSTGRAVKDRILVGPPKKEITKTDTLAGSILVILGGASRTRTLDRPVMSR